MLSVETKEKEPIRRKNKSRLNRGEKQDTAQGETERQNNPEMTTRTSDFPFTVTLGSRVKTVAPLFLKEVVPEGSAPIFGSRERPEQSSVFFTTHLHVACRHL